MSAPELQKYNDVKKEFLQLDYNKVVRKMEKRMINNRRDRNDSKKLKSDSTLSTSSRSTSIYTNEQRKYEHLFQILDSLIISVAITLRNTYPMK